MLPLRIIMTIGYCGAVLLIFLAATAFAGDGPGRPLAPGMMVAGVGLGLSAAIIHGLDRLIVLLGQIRDRLPPQQ